MAQARAATVTVRVVVTVAVMTERRLNSYAFNHNKIEILLRIGIGQ